MEGASVTGLGIIQNTTPLMEANLTTKAAIWWYMMLPGSQVDLCFASPPHTLRQRPGEIYNLKYLHYFGQYDSGKLYQCYEVSAMKYLPTRSPGTNVIRGWAGEADGKFMELSSS